MAFPRSNVLSYRHLWFCIPRAPSPPSPIPGLGASTPPPPPQAMLTTDQYYTLSSKCPEVKWLRQVHPDKMTRASLSSDGR